MQRQEIAAGLLQLLESHRTANVFIGNTIQLPLLAAKFHVRDRLDIK